MSERNNKLNEITPGLMRLAMKAETSCHIEDELYVKYDVKRGLRDLNGKGVLAGLTNVSDVRWYKTDETGQPLPGMIPDYGQLFYRGYNVKELVEGFSKEKRHGFEEVTYLLLFNELPNKDELKKFRELLARYRTLPTDFVRDIILTAPSRDMMNTLARSVLTLYSYDDNSDDTSMPNVLRQCLQLISVFPLLSIYGYHAYTHYHDHKSLIIHQPDLKLGAAENILHILREDSKYTRLEAQLLDLALVLHMEHGGGNNSSFTTHVITSTMTDTYSVMAAALGSLKGPRHGGANIKVVHMIEDLKENISDWKDEEAIADYLGKLLHREAFDRQGLIYGVGHAVYSLSDPREEMLHSFARKLSEEKGLSEEFDLYERVGRLAPQVIAGERKIYKGVCVNVDFYSGFVYKMLGLPEALFTPIFAMARIVGWSAHRIEELAGHGKIIRPAYLAVGGQHEYTALSKRNEVSDWVSQKN